MTFQHRTAAVGARFAHATRPIQELSAPPAAPAAPAMVQAGPAADPEPLPPCFLDTLALDLALAEPTPPAAAPIDAKAIYSRLNSRPAKATGKPAAQSAGPAEVYGRFNRAGG